MAETPLAKHIINTITALEQAVLAAKALKDYLAGSEQKPEEKPEEGGEHGET
jgi:hypothetical protein